MTEEPYFLPDHIDPLIHALNDFAAGGGSSLLVLLRDSPFRQEFRAIVTSMQPDSPAWQIPSTDPPEPLRCMGEVHDLVIALAAQEASQAAVEEMKDGIRPAQPAR